MSMQVDPSVIEESHTQNMGPFRGSFDFGRDNGRKHANRF
jgi:hypothetical protein